jgi:GntR family transcriptional regulator
MTIDKQIEPSGAGQRGSASPIVFRLDHASGVPTYLQLVQQVEHALRLGYLGQGDRLPTVKEVVSALAINPNTVLKAYRELEHRGLAAGRPGQGTFVQATPGTVGLPELTALRKTLLTWLRSADAAGLDEAGMVALFTSALRDFGGERGGVPPEQRRHDRRGETPVPGARDGGRSQAGISQGVA